MKILVTGAGGQVGHELVQHLPLLVPNAAITAVDVADCDLADAAAIVALLERTRPDVIINPAAYTDVERAEAEPERAHAINGAAPGIFGEAARKLGTTVIHFSTDYVFDGTKAGAYNETDTPGPLSEYGRSKLAGERALAASGARYAILRTSWVVGAHGHNFARTMLRLAAERDELRVVADQFGVPTSAKLLTRVTARLLMGEELRDRSVGLLHVAPTGETTWHGYARFVVAEALARGHALRTTPERIVPIATADYPTKAARPHNSRLDTKKLQDTFAFELPPWQNGVRDVLAQIL